MKKKEEELPLEDLRRARVTTKQLSTLNLKNYGTKKSPKRKNK
jgi:hypothetical protein